MKTYRVDQHQIRKPSKLIERPDGYEVTSNDGKIKIELRRTVVMDGSMESVFFHTTLWVKEDNTWIRGDVTQSYRNKEAFIEKLKDVEDFSEAVSEYQNNNNNDI